MTSTMKTPKPSDQAVKRAKHAEKLAAKAVKLLTDAVALFSEAGGYLEDRPAKHLSLLCQAAEKVRERAASTTAKLFPAPAAE